jgi:putative MFS transporter
VRKALNLTVLVAALGYFVDMFDLTIFGAVRISSLTALGVTDAGSLTSNSVLLINLQAAGMLIGGIAWGILGDKKGRLSVLFGSILLYSAANILNAYVTTLTAYGVLRFLAGIGLAGELGAAVTLVSEFLPKEVRGYGTTLIATLGLLGAVAAALIGQICTWQTAYLVGGGMGIFLLIARFKMVDSAMFKSHETSSHRGDPLLFLSGGRFSRYIYCVLVGIPIYFTTGILLTFAPELSSAFGLKGITAGNALLFGTIGLSVGDLLSGLLSQWLKSRKRAIYVSLALGACFTAAYFSLGRQSTEVFYLICLAMGAAAGYWAVLITTTAEQFGTNIRATAATSVPNMVRSSVILLTTAFTTLKFFIGVTNAAIAIGVAVFALAAFAVSRLRETYGRDLDFMELPPNAVSASVAEETASLGSFQQLS